jgi:Reverse transcriptase (RNA-dependent DNA polymerase)
MEEKKKKDWFKARGYRHLTNKTSSEREAKEKILRLVQNPSLVAKHAFFPLLHEIIPQRRYKMGEDAQGRPRRAHREFKKNKWQSTKKRRPIHFPTHIDAHIYSYYAKELLEPAYEQILAQNPALSDTVLAYRCVPISATDVRGKSTAHFAKEVFDFIKQKGECCAMAFDITDFFSSLDHELLKKIWAALFGKTRLDADHYNVYKSVTRFAYVLLDDLKISDKKHFDEQKLARIRQQGIDAFFASPAEMREQIKAGKLPIFKNNRPKGIPQGLPMSSILANLYLLDFDKAILEKVNALGSAIYRRYSDDIIVVCNTDQRADLEQFIYDKIKEFKLDIASAKTEICLFRYNDERVLTSFKVSNQTEKPNQPLKYLGFEFYGHKTLIKSASLAKFYRRMKAAICSKIRRWKLIKEKYLLDNPPLITRKLYRVYTDAGTFPRTIYSKRTIYCYDKITRRFVPKTKIAQKQHRGNMISYVRRVSRTMESPEILKQIKNHRKIFEKYLKKRLDEL